MLLLSLICADIAEQCTSSPYCDFIYESIGLMAYAIARSLEAVKYTTSNEVCFDEKIYINNVYNELVELEKMGRVKLYKYDDLDKWETYLQHEHLESGLQNRASYCSRKEELEFFEMVCQYFPKIKNHIKMV